MSVLRIIEVRDEEAFGGIPPCADPRFDHRTCDFWEDADRGRRDARVSWLARSTPAAPASARPHQSGNPFAPPAPAAEDENPFLPRRSTANPFLLADDDGADAPVVNPFAPAPRSPERPADGAPRKLQLLGRGLALYGSYGRILLADDRPVAWAQIGPLSAYPRAQRIRELYPRLPDAPLPAVITCVATVAEARGRGYGSALVRGICEELATRGFAAVEAYPEVGRPADETSAATLAFWIACGFHVAAPDDRFPVLRRELA